MKSIIGKVQGLLTVVDRAGPKHVLCRCTCGNTVTVLKSNMYRNNTTSCGCVKKSCGGLSKKFVNEYNTWSHMLRRCNDPCCPSFPRYGGRGIKVCEMWLHSFEKFLDDMGVRPSPELSIDRIDNDGDYEPDNCRWANRKTQANNTSSNTKIFYKGENLTVSQWSRKTGIPATTIINRLKNCNPNPLGSGNHAAKLIEHDGKSQSIVKWANETGIPAATISARLNTYNMSIQEALTRPLNRSVYTYNGVSHSITEWAKIYSIPRRTLAARLTSYNWPIDKALTTPARPKKRNKPV